MHLLRFKSTDGDNIFRCKKTQLDHTRYKLAAGPLHGMVKGKDCSVDMRERMTRGIWKSPAPTMASRLGLDRRQAGWGRGREEDKGLQKAKEGHGKTQSK